ncbi:MAG: VCBS repeat-containing protein, partial [Roseomonas sp.]|nr:VCBS repeat-containing protein [Roseomonas sp.]
MSDILGTSGNDTVTEGSGFSGGSPGAGNDTISGLGGNDVVAGGGGNDRLIGDSATTTFIAAANPFSGIAVNGSFPSFVDLDGDGDLDLVLGEYYGTILSWRREANGSYTAMDGTSGRPSNPFANIDVGYRSTPSFTDLDGDGDLDLVVGQRYGTLSAWRREANGSYTAMDGTSGRPANPFTGIDVGRLSTPSFTDLDGDGDLDLVVGELYGRLFAWRREANGSYTAMDGTEGRPANPFGGIDVGLWSAPSFTDLDGDSDLDLVVGEYSGSFLAWRREADGSYTAMDGANGRPANPLAGINTVGNSAPSFSDLDGDGRAELVGGTFAGMLQVFAVAGIGNDSLSGGLGNDTLNGGWGRDTLDGSADHDLLSGGGDADSLIGAAGDDVLDGGAGDDRLIGDTTTTAFAAAANPFAGIDVGERSAPSFTDLDGDGDLDLVVGKFNGTLLAWRREANGSYTAMDGTAGRPANPFAGIDVDERSTPSFADLDGDGDLDLVVGEAYGRLLAWRRETNGSYTPMDGAAGRPANPFNGIDVGSLSAPSFIDLDGDGDLDLVVGEYFGTILSWRREANGT